MGKPNIIQENFFILYEIEESLIRTKEKNTNIINGINKCSLLDSEESVIDFIQKIEILNNAISNILNIINNLSRLNKTKN